MNASRAFNALWIAVLVPAGLPAADAEQAPFGAPAPPAPPSSLQQAMGIGPDDPGNRRPDRLPLDIRVLPQGFLQRVELDDGRVFYGRIASGGNPVRLGLAEGGVVEIARERIRRVDEVRGTVVDGRFWAEDPNHTRLFFGPTGRNLPQGRGSVNAYYGVVPFLAVGITDRITLAGGASLVRGERLSLFPSGTGMEPDEEALESSGRLIHLAPKVQLVGTERLSVATGTLVFLRTDDPSAPTGIGYAVGTWSPTPRTSVTVGAGLGLIRGEWESAPVWMVGADRRLTRRVKVLTESYVFPGGEAVGIGGVRILGHRISADAALAVRPGAESRQVLPVFNLSVGW